MNAGLSASVATSKKAAELKELQALQRRQETAEARARAYGDPNKKGGKDQKDSWNQKVLLLTIYCCAQPLLRCRPFRNPDTAYTLPLPPLFAESCCRVPLQLRMHTPSCTPIETLLGLNPLMYPYPPLPSVPLLGNAGEAEARGRTGDAREELCRGGEAAREVPRDVLRLRLISDGGGIIVPPMLKLLPEQLQPRQQHQRLIVVFRHRWQKLCDAWYM